MGLAASQARLLTITARKADCEFQSMALSHQKLALSRDMEKVSNEYQEALNTTKLVYDYYGSGDSDIALTYGLLMSPSVYNDYYPKLVTDSKNRVILNSAYASAARAAGIPAEGLSGTPSSAVRNAFIEALAAENIISTIQAATIESITYDNTLGNGSTISATQGTVDLSYEELLNQIAAYTSSADSYGITLGVDKSIAYYYEENNEQKPSYGNQEQFAMVTEGNYTNINGNTVTLAELLSDDTEYILGLNSRTGDELAVSEAAYLQNKIAGKDGILDWIRAQFYAVLGGLSGNETAIEYAYNCVYDLIMPNQNIQDYCSSDKGSNNLSKGKSDREEIHEWENDELRGYMDEIGCGERTSSHTSYDTGKAMKADDYLGFYYTGDKNQGWKHKDRNDSAQISINLNNIAQAFLTSYVEYMQGIDDSEYQYQKGLISDSNLYNPKTDDFLFTVPVEAEIDDNDTALYSNFYDSMFNRICLQGWTENALIDDEDYLSEMLKNSMAYISSISDDGYYYQGNYATDRAILEVTDDEAVSKAEAKYNTEKVKIENKEDTIDLKMKNLDTEISSLTTEYDTTKQVITKSIEKSFKRYDA